MSRIMIIDDEDQIRLMLGMTFEDSGFEVVLASNGKEALEKFQHEPCDAVITDIVMPEKEGIETLVDFQALYPDVKVIAISGGGKGSPENYLRSAKALGAFRVFSKPIDRQMLVDAVHEALALRV